MHKLYVCGEEAQVLSLRRDGRTEEGRLREEEEGKGRDRTTLGQAPPVLVLRESLQPAALPIYTDRQRGKRRAEAQGGVTCHQAFPAGRC